MDNIQKTPEKVFSLLIAFYYLNVLKKTIEKMDDFDLIAFKGYHMRGKEEFFEKFFTDERWDEMDGIQKIITNDYTDYSKEVDSEKVQSLFKNSCEAHKILFREGARLILFEVDDMLNVLVLFMSEKFPNFFDDQWNFATVVKNQKLKLTEKEVVDLKERVNNEESLKKLLCNGLKKSPWFLN